MNTQSEPAPTPDDLGPDLSALIGAHPAAVLCIVEITGIPTQQRRRAAFRIEYEDGLVLKGRRFETVEKARRVTALRRRLGEAFSPIVAHRGDAVLESWIIGEPLPEDPPPMGLIEEAGALLGSIHRTPDVDLEEGSADIAERTTDRMQQKLKILHDAGAISTEQLARAGELVAGGRPETAESGLIHRDFSRDNIVVTPRRQLVCIDNANLSTGAFDCDLGRAFQRWPLDAEGLNRFIDGYERHRSAGSFLEHFVFWTLESLLTSAASRLKSRSGDEQEFVDRLLRVVEDAGAFTDSEISSANRGACMNLLSKWGRMGE